jgi:hypothetical protein
MREARNYYCIIRDAECRCKEKTARKHRFLAGFVHLARPGVFEARVHASDVMLAT